MRVHLLIVIFLLCVPLLWAGGSAEDDQDSVTSPETVATNSTGPDAGRWDAADAAGEDSVGHADGELTLDEALTMALDASQAVRRSELDVEIARAELEQARAGYWPQVDARVGAAYLANPPEGVSIAPGEFGTVSDPASTFPTRVPDEQVVLVPDAENLGLSASVRVDQPVYTWGKLRAAERAADAGVSVSRARSDRSRRELRRDVTRAFAGVVAGRQSAALVREMVSIQERRVADARSRFDAGAITRREVLAEERTLATIRAQLVRVEQGVRSGESSLAWLLGLPVAAGSEEALPGELVEPDFPRRLPAEAELARRAREGSPRLAELRSRSEQAAVQLAVEDASRPFLPDIGLQLEAEVQGQRVPLLQANWSDSWDANLTLSIGASASLFDGGANRASRASARAQYEQSLSAVAEYADALPLEVRTALESYRVSRASEDEARARLAEAREAARVAQVSRENDLITRSELLGARLAVLEARLAVIRARLEAAQALSSLEYLAGPLRDAE